MARCCIRPVAFVLRGRKNDWPGKASTAYNLCRIDRIVCVRLAMAAGLIKQVWEVSFLLPGRLSPAAPSRRPACWLHTRDIQVYASGETPMNIFRE